MRAFFRAIYLDCVGHFCRPKKGVHILNGHYLSRAAAEGTSRFDGLLKGLRNFSEFLDIEDAVRLVISGDCENFDGVGIAFTFDDGFLDCYKSLAPSLSQFGVNACFFINPGFIDGSDDYCKQFTDQVVLTSGKRPMTWSQVRELHDAGFVIGNHTIDHCRLSQLSEEELQQQIVGAQSIIEKKLGARVDYFAWPYGQADDIGMGALSLACETHKFVFSGFGYRDYFSFGGRVINRRHFEADWKLNYMRYFLSVKKNYLRDR